MKLFLLLAVLVIVGIGFLQDSCFAKCTLTVDNYLLDTCFSVSMPEEGSQYLFIPGRRISRDFEFLPQAEHYLIDFISRIIVWPFSFNGDNQEITIIISKDGTMSEHRRWIE